MNRLYERMVSLRNLEKHILTMYARGWGVHRRRVWIFWHESDESLRGRVLARMGAHS